MATWSSQVGPVFAGAVAVAWRGAVGALACGAWSAVALTANANNRLAMVLLFLVLLLQRPARVRDVTATSMSRRRRLLLYSRAAVAGLHLPSEDRLLRHVVNFERKRTVACERSMKQ